MVSMPYLDPTPCHSQSELSWHDSKSDGCHWNGACGWPKGNRILGNSPERRNHMGSSCMRNHTGKRPISVALRIHGWALRNVVRRLLGHSSSKYSDRRFLWWAKWMQMLRGGVTACWSKVLTVSETWACVVVHAEDMGCVGVTHTLRPDGGIRWTLAVYQQLCTLFYAHELLWLSQPLFGKADGNLVALFFRKGNMTHGFK